MSKLYEVVQEIHVLPSQVEHFAFSHRRFNTKHRQERNPWASDSQKLFLLFPREDVRFPSLSTLVHEEFRQIELAPTYVPLSLSLLENLCQKPQVPV